MSRFALALTTAVLGGVAGAAIVAAVIALGPGFDGGETRTLIQPNPMGRPVADGERGLTARDIYKRDAPGVVFVRSEVAREGQTPFDLFGGGPQRGQSTGSGFVIGEDGLIATNAHVVDGAQRIVVSFGKRTVPARLVGQDVSTDLALLKVDPDGLDLRALPLGDSGTVEVGDPTIAIGNPFGLDRTLTTGVVSALQRRIEAPNGFAIEDVIQTDAAINPGNSGGPLLDAAGRVIGINSQIATGGGGGNVGIGFAVPINTAKKVLPQLEKAGRVERPYLGVSGQAIAGEQNLAARSGVLVTDVVPGSPAARAGIRGAQQDALTGEASGGDIVTKVDGRAVSDMADLTAALEDKRAGDEVSLEVVRAGRAVSLTVELGQRPNEVPTG